MASKFYAVKKGIAPGVYNSWAECKKMVDGYSGAVYKSFPTFEEASTFAGVEQATATVQAQRTDSTKNAEKTGETMPAVYAFVDGSYNIATKVYGYGGFLIHDGVRELVQGAGDDEEMASMRNVAGEILGSQAAIEKAIELGLSELVIYYDYMGIEMWAKGLWKRNKQGTIAYYDYVNSVKDKIKLTFCKVKGHSGVDGNEEADQLAKQAVGILE